jgi:methyl-accepting chemotaxis protein
VKNKGFNKIMAKAKSKPEELKKYKEYVKKSLSELTPILQKAAVGDFTKEIEIPKKEDEFSELFVGLSLMMEDLRELEEARRKTEEERKKTEAEHQKRLFELERWRKLTTERELKMVELKKEIDTLKEEIEELKR